MNKKNYDWILIFLPLIGGFFISLFLNSGNGYSNLIKPPLSPPGWLFPIVWSILYLLMGISTYIIYRSQSPYKQSALTSFLIQLMLNYIWPILFFGLNLKIIAFIEIIILIFAIVKMIREYLKISKISAYLQIPYLLWTLFATYLNLAIIFLN